MESKNKKHQIDPMSVHHDGEFVLTRDGKRAFGEIPSGRAKDIRREKGEIRLRIGKQEGDREDYGEKHVERPARLQQLRDNGYQNAHEMVEDVAQNYDAIYEKGRRLILYKKIDENKGLSLFVELTRLGNDWFYDVKTGMVTRNSYYKNKKPLWERAQGG